LTSAGAERTKVIAPSHRPTVCPAAGKSAVSVPEVVELPVAETPATVGAAILHLPQLRSMRVPGPAYVQLVPGVRAVSRKGPGI
jgi:hypothetical protein